MTRKSSQKQKPKQKPNPQTQTPQPQTPQPQSPKPGGSNLPPQDKPEMSNSAIVKRIAAFEDKDPGKLSLVKTKLTVSDLNQVSEDAVKAFKELFVATASINKDVVANILDVFGYEGFDPRNVYRTLILCATKAGISVQELQQDINMLLVIHHLRGNVNQKNMTSFKPKAKVIINTLLNRYQIQINVKTGSKAVAMTIPRIGAAFPIMGAYIAMQIPRDMSGIYESAALPDCMKSGSFPSIIPNGSHSTKILLLAYNLFASDMNVIITAMDTVKMDEAAKRTHFMSQNRFTEISFRSVVCDAVERKHAMVVLGLADVAVLKQIQEYLKKSAIIDFEEQSDDNFKLDVADWMSHKDYNVTIQGRISDNSKVLKAELQKKPQVPDSEDEDIIAS